jgi:hypothetical protein
MKIKMALVQMQNLFTTDLKKRKLYKFVQIQELIKCRSNGKVKIWTIEKIIGLERGLQALAGVFTIEIFDHLHTTLYNKI